MFMVESSLRNKTDCMELQLLVYNPYPAKLRRKCGKSMETGFSRNYFDTMMSINGVEENE